MAKEKCPHCKQNTLEQAVQNDSVPKGVWKCQQCKNIAVWCPACDQGWISKARIKKLGISLFICAECNATWKDCADIAASTGENLNVLLEKLGLGKQYTEIDFDGA